MNRRKMLQALAGVQLAGHVGEKAANAPPKAANPTHKIEHKALSLAHRIPQEHWMADDRFALLEKFLGAYRGVVDEIALCNDYGSWPPLERIAQDNPTLKHRIVQLKAQGWRTGINVGVTMGHGNTDDPLMPPLPFQAAIGHDGKVSNACPCPNDRKYRDYIRKKYALMAQTHPDFIWVDDDLRASHHGPTYPCFCAICLKMFGEETDREALVKELNEPAQGDLRRAWTEFRAASIESVCTDIRKAIVEVNPAVEIGLMTIGYSHSTYGGYAINRWMQALGAKRGRPGHGYYTDEAPRTQLLDKAINVGRQARDYPAAVKIIQYELETYPHIPLDKSTCTVMNECVAALMMGCNGIAFTLFPSTEVSYGDYDGVLSAARAERPDWEALLKGIASLPPVGFWPADNRLLMANRQVDATGWFWEHGVYEIQQPNESAEMGLPLTTDPKSACGVLLAGKVAEAFATAELRGFLAKGVLMDGFALGVLWARGLGELTGVKVGDRIPGGITERLARHPLNGRYAGERRDVLAGPSDGVCSLVPLGASVGDLAHLVRSDGSDAGCCFSTFTNALGGRVAVSTFGPWHRQGNSATRHRLLAVADWLAHGRLPVLIPQAVRVAPLVRMSPDGQRVAVVLLNAALDPTGPLKLRLRAQPPQVSLINQGKVTPLRTEREADGLVVHVPSLPPWQSAILVA
jgi:hypothetical protein